MNFDYVQPNAETEKEKAFEQKILESVSDDHKMNQFLDIEKAQYEKGLENCGSQKKIARFF